MLKKYIKLKAHCCYKILLCIQNKGFNKWKPFFKSRSMLQLATIASELLSVMSPWWTSTFILPILNSALPVRENKVDKQAIYINTYRKRDSPHISSQIRQIQLIQRLVRQFLFTKLSNVNINNLKSAQVDVLRIFMMTIDQQRKSVCVNEFMIRARMLPQIIPSLWQISADSSVVSCYYFGFSY